MAANKKETPDFFKDESFDPIEVATGPGRPGSPERSQDLDSEGPPHSCTTGSAINKPGVGPAAHKKKAGFYISVEVLNRFNRRFYELKLAGAAIENKSALLELALVFALDDLDKGTGSRVLKNS
jgi:hypothetical protein